MSTGLLFGSFDPFHIGHYNMCIQALNSKIIDRVYIIPAYQNPWKNSSTDFHDRINLIEMVLNDHDAWVRYHIITSAIEEDLAYELNTDKIHTCDTLDAINKLRVPGINDYWIIISDETLLDIRKWKRGEEILATNKFIIIPRESSFISPDLPFNKMLKWNILSDISSNISSTYIRNLIKENKIPVPWITENQYNYILRNNLYK